tara:strand:- start:216 stop:359 length:144 start_codon:yes stop_codon:yes gene_type:complete
MGRAGLTVKRENLVVVKRVRKEKVILLVGLPCPSVRPLRRKRNLLSE